MDPHAGRRIRIVADERDTFRRRRDATPRQRRRDVLPVARVLRRNRTAFRERGAAHFQSHCTSRGGEKESDRKPQIPAHFFGVDPAAGRAGGTPMSRHRFLFSSHSARARFRLTAAAAARASSSLEGAAFGVFAGASSVSATLLFYARHVR